VAPEVSSRNGALTKVAASSLSVVEEVKRPQKEKLRRELILDSDSLGIKSKTVLSNAEEIENPKLIR
jgi:hypothetical protein